jgi:hypothetical protein
MRNRRQATGNRSPDAPWRCPRRSLPRLAAHWALHGQLPAPGTRENVKNDAAVREYQEDFGPLDMVGEFDHLVWRISLYLPQPFDRLVVSGSGEVIGSSRRLLDELGRVAEALGIPPQLKADSSELIRATISPGRESWSRFPLETMACVCLMEAARASLQNRAAIDVQEREQGAESPSVLLS